MIYTRNMQKAIRSVSIPHEFMIDIMEYDLDPKNPFISIRGGQQIQVYPNKLELDVAWLVKYLETLCQGYMEVITQQSGTDDLKLCKPVVTSIWTIRQTEGDYQEMHSHPGGSISGNIYISAPELPDGCEPSDSQLLFRLPQTRDVNKFVMTDTWKYTPTPGTVIVFPSYLAHCVTPVTKGVRWALVGWVHGPSFV
jgi:hypothetical protein